MPKNFRGESTKSKATAKEKKSTKAAAERQDQARIVEDATWQETDKTVNKKNTRKDDRERKKAEELQRKQDNRDLVKEEEEATAATTRPTKTTHNAKVTLFQLEQQKAAAAREAAAAAASAAQVTTHLDEPLLENTNKMVEDVVSASGIEGAIKALDVDGGDGKPRAGKHVNMAAAFRAYEQQRMPSLKKENPTFKLSQLSQRLRKEWQKSPQNPINQMKLQEQEQQFREN